MAAVLKGLLPAPQTVTVKYVHFRAATRGIRYASISDQDVHEMIRSDPMLSWTLHIKKFWRLDEMERALSMHISVGAIRERMEQRL